MSRVSIAAVGVEETQLPDANPVYQKIAKRILPILIVSYLFAYLDRVNVGFAKLQMLDDLGLSEAAYGLGAGIFFVGYLLFEVPSNILMIKIGAKKTICRIMILWGLISMAFAFVQTPTQFYVLRFLLGVAEAGFYPGIILYLTFWFPSRTRAKMTAFFFTAVPVSGLLGGPISGWILSGMHSIHGLAGWQWLFLIEGLPSVLLGISIPWLLCNCPQDAKWLSAEEKRLVLKELDDEIKRKNREVQGNSSIGAMLRNPKVWVLTTICLGQAVCIYGISFWLPSMIRELGYKDSFQVGLISAIPFAAAAIALNIVGRSSDRRLERRWHTAVPFACAAASLFVSTLLKSEPIFALVALTVATMAAYSATTMFWTLPSLFLSGMGMAAAIGLINSLGGLGGFLSPYVIGMLKDATGSTVYGIYFISAIAGLGALLVLRLPKDVANR